MWMFGSLDKIANRNVSKSTMLVCLKHGISWMTDVNDESSSSKYFGSLYVQLQMRHRCTS